LNFVFGEMWMRPGLDQRATALAHPWWAWRIPPPALPSVRTPMLRWRAGNATVAEMHEFVLQYAIHGGWPKASVMQGVVIEMGDPRDEGSSVPIGDDGHADGKQYERQGRLGNRSGLRIGPAAPRLLAPRGAAGRRCLHRRSQWPRASKTRRICFRAIGARALVHATDLSTRDKLCRRPLRPRLRRSADWMRSCNGRRHHRHVQCRMRCAPPIGRKDARRELERPLFYLIQAGNPSFAADTGRGGQTSRSVRSLRGRGVCKRRIVRPRAGLNHMTRGARDGIRATSPSASNAVAPRWDGYQHCREHQDGPKASTMR